MDLYSTPLELLPLEGLRLGDTLLPLAASKEQAEALLGPTESANNRAWYYAENELRLDFDQSDRGSSPPSTACPPSRPGPAS